MIATLSAIAATVIVVVAVWILHPCHL